MPILRLYFASVLLALTACGAQARESQSEALQRPAVIAHMPYIAGIADDDRVHAEALTSIVRKAVKDRDFAALNAMETYFRKSRSRLPGGTWELDTFHSALRNAFRKRRAASEPCVLAGTDFTKAWAKYDPDQPGPYITEAGYRFDHAWCIRGDEYASSVAAEAWEPFRRNIDEAYEVLTDKAYIAKRDPEFYAQMQAIYMALGRDRMEYQRLLDEASAREPYYYALYFNAALHALPQWGGSAAEVDQTARYAAAKTRAQDGAGAYARVYWYLMQCNCEPAGLRIDRALLSQAMDDVFERTPSDWNLANFARLACRHGERELTARQFARGGREDFAQWKDRTEWQTCRTFAALKAPEPMP